ncbi:uncharacterized protein At4g19900-like [Cynara cardunculus var. scolymus]|uniref:Alpha 1,4-glycosyltransferase domain-containing protein n=1 Tax=Cynara cardunculus var. scolymus TaxID=59895 RepID=A0A103XU30_CYNCS|nr:uncharacterized protein At4g19900-like [Cynara cardunculus var. scolymus]KVH96871.1 Alpha 1,4-glycosyltransferase domain-containing protein [Cynara cardunculus var. scolymus]
MEFNTKNKKRSLFALISLVFLFLLSFNGASIFSVKIPSLGSHSPGKPVRDSRNLISVSSSSSSSHAVKGEAPSTISIPHLKLQTHSVEKPVASAGDSKNFVSVPYFRYTVQHPQKQMAPAKEETQNINPNTHLPLLRKSHSLSVESEDSPIRNKKLLKTLATLGSSRGRRGDDFPARVKEHFSKKNDSVSCKVRFFMTWISPLKSFTERAFHSIESIFKTHPNGCLLIVSNSLDSIKGRQILKPFSDNGFRVTAVSPDFSYLFKNTMAESWFSRLIQGHVHPGDIPLGQNISNLLRLCLLYKYGGVYIDTDVIVLKSFAKLKNSIGAQTIDPNSKNWSRLNNAVMVFDKMHPLLYKFIEEFALTFNGNKWGHNGPYMVSRVVSRLQGRPGFNFTVLPPMAFYPVNWDKVRILFRGAKNESDSRYLKGKLEQIRNQSYTVHLWNKQSRVFHIEDGSILRKILSVQCIFCGSSSNEYIANTIG